MAVVALLLACFVFSGCLCLPWRFCLVWCFVQLRLGWGFGCGCRRGWFFWVACLVGLFVGIILCFDLDSLGRGGLGLLCDAM